jgi:DNA polymerase-3 subunit alpha
VHSAYSLSKGAIKVAAIPQLCKKFDMPAVAITDINNLFGVMDIAQNLTSNGIQHIVGSQVSLKIGEKFGNPFLSPLILLAKSHAGYKNLIKLSTISYQNKSLPLEGPCLQLEHLREHSDGIICLTGGDLGPIGQFLLQKKNETAEGLLMELRDCFADNLYIEIMRHNLPNQKTLEPQFLELALKHAIAIVATNDVYFEDRNMHEAHDVLLCISNGCYLGEENREKSALHKYFKSQEEMASLFADLPEALENTVNIAKRCHFILEENALILPPFQAESGLPEKEELRRQAYTGLRKRLDEHVLPKASLEPTENQEDTENTELIEKRYTDRLENELAVIERMGFPGYFLIVADFIKYAKANGIPVGPGRGSGAGSLVAWSLTITEIDPIRFSLIFERFLNPERVSMPDFDVDFCQARRSEVIEYVVRRYGIDKVAQIITFGKLQARAVIRDVGRVLQIPYSLVDKVCRLIPNNPTHPVTLSEAIEADPAFNAMMHEDSAIEKLINIGLKLEGLYRHASVHAAGVVIGGQVISDVVPLYYDGESQLAITQINLKFIEKAGLLKFDFLGLKTLSVIQECVNLLKKQGITVNISSIPLNDAKTFKLLCDINVFGVFQIESAGMRDVLKKLRPDRFEDLIALVALYRPGPMDDIPKYLARKHGEEPVTFPHPSLQPILEKTYGVMVYQEQVMQIAQVMGGYTLGRADILRRAMGKKDKKEMDNQCKIFVDGATQNGISAGIASHVFDLMAKFASYGFNKSHSAPYALISYQTAYLKANYPLEFLAATASFEKNSVDKLVELFQDLKENGFELLPPDINKSFVNFAPEDSAMRYALSAIRNVGEGAMEILIAEREKHGPFLSIEDFASRMDPSSINKRQLENLIASGAFDSLNSNRKQLFNSVDTILRYANLCKQERTASARSLFGESTSTNKELLRLEQAPGEWNLLDKTKKELDALGFFLNEHPLALYKDIISNLNVQNSSMFGEMATENGTVARFAAILLAKEEKTSKGGSKFAFLTLSDPFSIFEVPFFSDNYAKIRDIIAPGLPVYIEAMLKLSDDGSYRITGLVLEKLDDKNTSNSLVLHIAHDCEVSALRAALETAGNGTCSIVLRIKFDEFVVKVTLPCLYNINPQTKADILTVRGVCL